MLQEEYNEMKNKIDIKDAAENLDLHLPEICAFGRKHKLTFGDALDHSIRTTPGREPDPHIKRNLFIRNGIKLEPDRNGPSSQLEKVTDNYELSFLMREYQNDVFFDNIHTNKFYGPVGFSPAITRNEASTTTSNIQTVGPAELAYPLVTDAQVADIIGERTVIEGSRFMALQVKEPTDYPGLVQIGEITDVGVWGITTGEKIEITSKAGFGVARSYEAGRSPYFVEQITAFTNRMAFRTQQALVNQGLTVLTSGTFGTDNTVTATTALMGKDIIEINLKAREGTDKFAYNLIVGGKDFLMEYGGIDLVQNTEAGFPLQPANRSFVDSIRAGQLILYRGNDEVSNLNSNGKDAFFADRRFCLRYVMERNSTIAETEIDMSDQSMTDYNTFSYVFSLMEPAANARLKAIVP